MLTCHTIRRPLGHITLYFEEEILIGIDISDTDQPRGAVLSHLGHYLPMEDCVERETPASAALVTWLDGYLAGEDNLCPVPLRLYGTPFQRRVWEALQQIPRGTTVRYGDICKAIENNGARAVGTAVGCNPIPILVPCHRVLPADGSLGNFSSGAGPETKAELLALEGAWQRG